MEETKNVHPNKKTRLIYFFKKNCMKKKKKQTGGGASSPPPASPARGASPPCRFPACVVPRPPSGVSLRAPYLPPPSAVAAASGAGSAAKRTRAWGRRPSRAPPPPAPSRCLGGLGLESDSNGGHVICNSHRGGPRLRLPLGRGWS